MLTRPATFAEALASRQARALLPSTLSAAELERLPADIREQATFSARVSRASHLARLERIIRQIVDPASSTGPGDYMSEPLARRLLRQSLAEIGYRPDPRDRGGIKDLSSEPRTRLQVQMGVDMARSYGQWRQGQDEDVLNEFPAWRFLPSTAREPRGSAHWSARWKAAGLPLPKNQMVALKTDPGWLRLSRFNLPYPPFDYGSTRDVEEVDRDEAIALGLIHPATRLQGASRPFEMPRSARIGRTSATLAQAISQAIPGARFQDGILESLPKGAAA